MATTRVTALGAAALLLLAGCSTPGDDLLPVRAGDPDDDLLPVEVGDPADDLLPVEVPVEGEECLPGSWLLDNGTWRDLVAHQAASEGATVNTPTGAVLLTLEEGGGYSVAYTAWEIRIESSDGTVVMSRRGTDAGGFDATESRVVLHETSSGSSVDGVVETSSGSFALPTGSSQAEFAEQFGYTCENDALTATVDGGVLLLSRAD